MSAAVNSNTMQKYINTKTHQLIKIDVLILPIYKLCYLDHYEIVKITLNL